jgi:hypothetical protein
VTECGEVVVANNCGHDVLVFAVEDGGVVTRFGEKGVLDGMFSHPAHVCTVGDQLFVMDWGSKRVQVFE